MRKRLVSTLLCAAMVAAMVVGCGSKPAAADGAATGATEAKTEAGAADSSDDSQAGDAQEENNAGGGKVGVSMPTKDLQRWNQDGENMKYKLEEAGYEVELQFAGNDVATQVSQVETMISNGCDVLVIGSIDGSSLGDPLAKAKEAEIPVVSYDRLIMNTDAISYYATFDNYLVGQKQGEYIVQALDLENAEGPFNLEIFTGDPADNNVNFFYGGAMDVLNPYIDSGKLVIPSGQKEKNEVATANWDTATAQSRMEAILASNYSDGTKLDVVLCSNDSTALGVTNALEASYTGDWPIITGQDCDIANVKNIIAGKQTMTIFKDTRALAEQTVKMVDAIMSGTEAEVNDTESYDNGTGVIPTYLCDPIVTDINNYKELLVDSGYYSEEDLK